MFNENALLLILVQKYIENREEIASGHLLI